MNKLESVVLADEVYTRLKLLIIEGELAPGAKIDKRKIAVELGVSPTPVNEAVSRLIGERFLERRAGRHEGEGLFVPELSSLELIHIFAVRAGLEGMAGRLAVELVKAGGNPAMLERLCERFAGMAPPFDSAKTEAYLAEDKLFHEGIIEASGNPILTDIDSNLGCVHRSWIRGLVRTPEVTLPEHQEIIEAFKSREPVKAQEALIQHNLRSRDALLAKIQAGH